jgi:hypothetical protein
MPLSEQEQRLLDEMERNLYRNDADFVSTVAGRRGKPSYRGIAIGALVALLGVAGLVLGVVLQMPLVGVLAFAVMLAGVMVAISPSKVGSKAAPRDARDIFTAPSRSTGQRPGGNKASSGGFMDKLNSRWERRQDDGNG